MNAATPDAALLCPACLGRTPERLVETYFDPIGRKDYRLLACGRCGTGFSMPHESPGPDFYARHNAGTEEATPGDWRYNMFLAEPLGPGRLLDIGCGRGRFLAMAQEKGFEACGFDFNPENIRHAKALGVKEAWACGLDEFLAQEPPPYDAITLFDVLEHVPEPAALLRHVHRLLKPGGHVAITVPNAARPRPLTGRRESYDYPPFHFTRWTADSLEQALVGSGFEPLRRGFAPLPLRFFSGFYWERFLGAVFPLLKRLLLGREAAQSGRTWTDLLGSNGAAGAPKAGSRGGALSSPGLRRKLVDAGQYALAALCFPVEAPLVLALRALRPEKGRTIYLLARRK